MPRMSMAWRCFSQAPDYSCTELFLRQNKKGAITRYISTPYTPEGRLKVESVAPAAGANINPPTVIPTDAFCIPLSIATVVAR